LICAYHTKCSNKISYNGSVLMRICGLMTVLGIFPPVPRLAHDVERFVEFSQLIGCRSCDHSAFSLSPELIIQISTIPIANSLHSYVVGMKERASQASHKCWKMNSIEQAIHRGSCRSSIMIDPRCDFSRQSLKLLEKAWLKDQEFTNSFEWRIQFRRLGLDQFDVIDSYFNVLSRVNDIQSAIRIGTDFHYFHSDLDPVEAAKMAKACLARNWIYRQDDFRGTDKLAVTEAMTYYGLPGSYQPKRSKRAYSPPDDDEPTVIRLQPYPGPLSKEGIRISFPTGFDLDEPELRSK